MSSESVLVQPEQGGDLWRAVKQITGRDAGESAWGTPVNHTSYSSTSNFAHVLENQAAGDGKHLQIPNVLQVLDSGMTVSVLTVNGRLTLGEHLRFTAANARIIAGPTSLQLRNAADDQNNVHIADNGSVTLRNLLTVSAGGASIVGAVGIVGNVGITGDTTMTGSATVTQSFSAGDATTDAATFLATTTFRSATATETALFVDTTTAAQVVRIGTAAAPLFTASVAGAAKVATFGAAAAIPLYVDVTNNRVILGSTTALSGAGDDKLSVVGGAAHIASATATAALGIRHTAAGETWLIGAHAATNPDLIFQESATEIIRFGALGATRQLDVNGNTRLDGDVEITGTLSGGGLTFASLSLTGNLDAAKGVFGSTTFSGAEELRVVGQTRLEGATEITTGGLSVVGGGLIDTVNFNGTNTVFSLSGTTQTQTTVGAAGAASALPANPTGYIKIVVGGSDFCFPYYLRS